MADVAPSYDRVAAEYARRIGDELGGKPLDRALLAAVAEECAGRGPVADVGCGPGHVTAHLRSLGAEATGIDVSPGMVAVARAAHPGLRFDVGSMLALPVPDGALAGVVCLYAVIHLPPGDLDDALREMRRALRPGGPLLVAFHIGDEVVHLDEWWGHDVDLDFRYLRTADMAAALERCGYTVTAVLERAPYADVEHPSRRGYLLAHAA